LDAYINQLYRCVKSRRDGVADAALLDEMESPPWLLETVFALHGRLRPYNRYLRWELENFPLPDNWNIALMPERVGKMPCVGFLPLRAWPIATATPIYLKAGEAISTSSTPSLTPRHPTASETSANRRRSTHLQRSAPFCRDARGAPSGLAGGVEWAQLRRRRTARASAASSSDGTL
jgi:hypothetical protein